ncbi:MAG: VPLPA-CTERM sorting domain-containing protein [Gammaproteobacteria bacterium]
MNPAIRRAALPSLVASMAIALLSQQATAATISTSAIIPVTSGSGFTLLPISGLAQFDPSQGTLTGITFSLDISNYDVTLSLSSWDDPGTGAQFQSANLSGQFSIDAALPGGGGLLFSSTAFGNDLYDEFGTVDVFGFSGGPVLEDAMARLTTEGLLTSFIGTGNVSLLSFGVYSFGYPDMVELDDGSFADGNPYIDAFNVGPSTVTIDYAYTPAVVPLPAGIWLLGSALLGLAGIKRRVA